MLISKRAIFQVCVSRAVRTGRGYLPLISLRFAPPVKRINTSNSRSLFRHSGFIALEARASDAENLYSLEHY